MKKKEYVIRVISKIHLSLTVLILIIGLVDWSGKVKSYLLGDRYVFPIEYLLQLLAFTFVFYISKFWFRWVFISKK